MSKHLAGRGLNLDGALFAAHSLAAADVPVSKDLMTVITLPGLPCGEVVGVKRLGDNDYVASCEDGNRTSVYQCRGPCSRAETVTLNGALGDQSMQKWIPQKHQVRITRHSRTCEGRRLRSTGLQE